MRKIIILLSIELILFTACMNRTIPINKRMEKVSCRGFDYSNYDTCKYYNNYYLVTKNKKKMLLKKDGKEVFDTFYNAIIVTKKRDRFIVKNDNGKFGLINSKGEVFIPFQYDLIYNGMSDNIFIVSKDKKFGIVDYENHTILDTIYEKINSYHLTIELNGEIALIDKFGNITSPFFKNNYKYIFLIRKSNGYHSVAKESGKQALMNPKGEIVTPFIYPDIKHYINDLFMTEKTVWEAPIRPIDNRPVMMHGHQVTGLIDKNGKELVSLQHGGASIHLMDWIDKKVIYIKGGSSDKFYDVDGKFLFSFKEGIHIDTKIHYMSDKTPYLHAYKNSKEHREIYGILTLKGDEILPFKYRSIYYKNGFFEVSKLVKNHSKFLIYGLIDNRGKIIAEIKYKRIDFDNNFFYLRDIDGNVGRLLSTGQVLVPSNYKFIIGNISKNGLYLVSQNRQGFEKSRVVFYDTVNQKEIYKEFKKSIKWLSGFYKDTDFLGFRNDTQYGVLDQNFKIIIPCRYDRIYLLKDKSTFLVEKDGVKSYFLKIKGEYKHRDKVKNEQ